MNGREDMEQTGNSSLRGVFAAALTPMGGDLDPDHAAFVAHCRRLLNAGCHGLVHDQTTFRGTERCS
jgi:dihydrodipicolinate synthase/N-acetylneuraminate lyase